MKRRGRNATNLSVSLPGELLELLRQAAFDDNRTVSSLVAALVRGHLDREGYLKTTCPSGPMQRQTRLPFE